MLFSWGGKRVYIYERITNLYKEAKKQFPNIIGSEYLGDDKFPGHYYEGVLHEDAMNLSFEDDSFDMLLSADVFEHVADYKKAFSECYRVMKPGGNLIFSIPFTRRKDTVVRAQVKNGKIVHNLPPVYHGNPISNEGSLVYTDFGWDIMDVFKEIGFRDAFLCTYFSVDKCYLGKFPVVFHVIK